MTKKRGEIVKRSFIETIVAVYLFSMLFGVLILVSTGGVWNTITGWASSSTTSLIINFNNPPTVSVRATTTTVSITEDGRATANFTFTITDLDGIAEIDNTTAFIRLNLTGETDRVNQTCAGNGTIGTQTYSYRCQVDILYWDAAGNWTINASVRDTNGAYAQNISQQIEVYSTVAMQMYPRNLTWPTIQLGASNQTSNNDPVIINNTGNKDIGIGGVQVTGYSLQGVIVPTEFIDVRNFTVSPKNGSVGCSGNACFECNGTTMLNQTAVPLLIANITAGNHTISNLFNETGPEESLFFCMRTVPDSSQISAQTFGTNGTHTAVWTIAVS